MSHGRAYILGWNSNEWCEYINHQKLLLFIWNERRQKKNLVKLLLHMILGISALVFPISRNRLHAQHFRMDVYIIRTFFFAQLFVFFFFFLFKTAHGYKWLLNRWYTGSEISMYMRESLSLCQICIVLPHICQKKKNNSFTRSGNEITMRNEQKKN